MSPYIDKSSYGASVSQDEDRQTDTAVRWSGESRAENILEVLGAWFCSPMHSTRICPTVGFADDFCLVVTSILFLLRIFCCWNSLWLLSFVHIKHITLAQFVTVWKELFDVGFWYLLFWSQAEFYFWHRFFTLSPIGKHFPTFEEQRMFKTVADFLCFVNFESVPLHFAKQQRSWHEPVCWPVDDAKVQTRQMRGSQTSREFCQPEAWWNAAEQGRNVVPLFPLVGTVLGQKMKLDTVIFSQNLLLIWLLSTLLT